MIGILANYILGFGITLLQTQGISDRTLEIKNTVQERVDIWIFNRNTRTWVYNQPIRILPRSNETVRLEPGRYQMVIVNQNNVQVRSEINVFIDENSNKSYQLIVNTGKSHDLPGYSTARSDEDGISISGISIDPSLKPLEIKNPLTETVNVWVFNNITRTWVYGQPIELLPGHETAVPLGPGYYQFIFIYNDNNLNNTVNLMARLDGSLSGQFLRLIQRTRYRTVADMYGNLSVVPEVVNEWVIVDEISTHPSL